MELREIEKRLRSLKANPCGVGQYLLQQYLNLLNDLYVKRQAFTKEEILKHAHQMHYVARCTQDKMFLINPPQNAGLYFMDNTHISTKSCSFDAKPELEATGLTKLGTIATYHSYGGHYMFLRPSVDEAIWQCPKEWQDKAVAFEFAIPSSVEVESVYDRNLDLHILNTTFYAGETPRAIKERTYYW
ncbi:MAG: hypothetical protein IKW58_00620 [Alphaproteobacteria bacterium]|nr:hypothetical protein [Alphaproteobacteria bacterium]